MTLTARDIAEITRLLEDSSFDELRLEIDGLKLHLKRGGPVAARTVPNPPAAAASAAVEPVALEPAPPDEPGAGNDGLVDVTAPMLGTYYRAPKPGERPFIEPGSRVDAETIIGIIEVMKLMNTVRAGVRGTVAEILVSDGSLVEYGQTLLRVRRIGEP